MVRVGGAFTVVMLAICVLAPGAQAVSIDVAGPEEVVYDYATMSCFAGDVPDGPARVFRDATNQVQLWLSGGNTRMLGPNLTSLTHDCTRVIAHHKNPDPAAFDDGDWLSGHWTDDGQTIYALIHAEYHGQRHPGWCPGEPFIKCRYNTVTFARSTDGGETFQHGPGTADLVAAPPYRYVPGDGRYGYFAPSNIVRKDGWFYSMFLVSVEYKEQRGGVCVMRTQTPGDTKSWRAWDGDGFNVKFVDPYRESPAPVERHVCQPVSYGALRDINRSLTYNSFLDKYMVVGTTSKYEAAESRIVTGFYYSLSDDLVNWSDRELLLEHETQATFLCGDPNPRAYPSIIDPSSTDRNFSTVGQNAYLYFTELIYSNCMLQNERDMLRVPIQVTP